MFAAALLSLSLAQAAASPAPSLGQGRALLKDFYALNSAQVWSVAAPSYQRQMGSEAAVKAFAAKLQRDFGKELRVITEGLSSRGDFTVYRRVASFSNWARGVELEVLFDDSGKVTSLSARPASKEAPTTYGTHKTKARLRLPFEGQWYVLWGGRSWEHNRHSAVPDQRYALDLLRLTRSGGSFEGDGSKNEQYAAWGQPVVAAGEGVVVTAEDGVTDNEPNHPRGGNLFGNHVVIDHGTGEYSLVAHLMKGSVQVKPGDHVIMGQQLARTGNSGMSTEPHIHYQLMDKPDWQQANGFPAQFLNFQLGDRIIERGEPRRADLIAPVPLEARR